MRHSVLIAAVLLTATAAFSQTVPPEVRGSFVVKEEYNCTKEASVYPFLILGYEILGDRVLISVRDQAKKG